MCVYQIRLTNYIIDSFKNKMGFRVTQKQALVAIEDIYIHKIKNGKSKTSYYLN